MAQRNRWFTELKNGDFPWPCLITRWYIYIYIISLRFFQPIITVFRANWTPTLGTRKTGSPLLARSQVAQPPTLWWPCLRPSDRSDRSARRRRRKRRWERQWSQAEKAWHAQHEVSSYHAHMGVFENSVPLNPMVNDHYPYEMAIIGNIPYFQTNPYAPWCWNIYQHLPHKLPSHVGKYTIHGAYGMESPVENMKNMKIAGNYGCEVHEEASKNGINRSYWSIAKWETDSLMWSPRFSYNGKYGDLSWVLFTWWIIMGY